MKIVISGNIGSGKTSQIKRLQEEFKNHKSIEIIPEAVQEWIDEGWLGRFYENPKKYSLGFQFRVLQSQIKLPDMDICTIVERSLHTTTHIFSKQLVEDGMISSKGYESILKFVDKNNWKPTCFIYIKTPPEVCHQRIKERSRDEESMIPLEYLENIHEKHEKFHKSNEYLHYEIDGTLTQEEVFYKIMQVLYTHLLEPTVYNESCDEEGCIPTLIQEG